MVVPNRSFARYYISCCRYVLTASHCYYYVGILLASHAWRFAEWHTCVGVCMGAPILACTYNHNLRVQYPHPSYLTLWYVPIL